MSATSSRVWLFAAGYFAAYVPYALLTKLVSNGGLTDHAWSGTTILPIATLTSMVSMFVVVSVLGWWHYAAHATVLGRRVPVPRLATLASGVATAVIVTTTTLAYAFDGISILFAMLLMRGGVILLAPLVDKLTGRALRSIPWWSWVGSALALAALVVAFAEDGVASLSLASGVDIALYLVAYFFRLRWMSLHAKGDRTDARAQRIAFFVEEQMVATPLAVVGLALLALLMPNDFGQALQVGFIAPWSELDVLALIALLGLCSQFTGTFGALVLLEPQENAFTVPVNRASSVLAGVAASLVLTLAFAGPLPSGFELVGAGLVVGAITILAWPTLTRRWHTSGTHSATRDPRTEKQPCIDSQGR